MTGYTLQTTDKLSIGDVVFCHGADFRGPKSWIKKGWTVQGNRLAFWPVKGGVA